jgi:ribonuclease R
MQRKYARWANQHIGETFQAKVVATTPELKVELFDTIQGASIHVTNQSNAVLFQHVNIRIENVDIYRAKISGSIVEE